MKRHPLEKTDLDGMEGELVETLAAAARHINKTYVRC